MGWLVSGRARRPRAAPGSAGERQAQARARAQKREARKLEVRARLSRFACSVLLNHFRRRRRRRRRRSLTNLPAATCSLAGGRAITTNSADRSRALDGCESAVRASRRLPVCSSFRAAADAAARLGWLSGCGQLCSPSGRPLVSRVNLCRDCRSSVSVRLLSGRQRRTQQQRQQQVKRVAETARDRAERRRRTKAAPREEIKPKLDGSRASRRASERAINEQV